jgi:hypothetical protein
LFDAFTEDGVFDVFSAEGVWEGAGTAVIAAGVGVFVEVAYDEAIDVEPDVGVPLGAIDAPVVEFLGILFAAERSQPIFDIGERVVIEGGVSRGGHIAQQNLRFALSIVGEKTPRG